MKVSLIISTYNRPDALHLCLESVLHQTTLPDEVIIGDDGSKEETRFVIEKFQKKFPVPLIHIWQEDNGFQLAKARNKCIVKASYEYIIQIDGDLILHQSFVADHIAFAKKGCYIKGGRVNLNDWLTQKLCSSLQYKQPNFFTRGLLRRINSIHCLPVARYLAPRRKSAPGLGCNMGYWREDAVKINGYDEFYVGWGGEDYDFAVRLSRLGNKKMALKFAAIVFHLWHNDLYMDNKEKNFEHYYNVKDGSNVRCETGISQYL